MSQLFTPIRLGTLTLSNRIRHRTDVPVLGHRGDAGRLAPHTPRAPRALGRRPADRSRPRPCRRPAASRRATWGFIPTPMKPASHGCCRRFEPFHPFPSRCSWRTPAARPRYSVPWEGGAQVAPAQPGGWKTEAPSPLPFAAGGDLPAALDAAGLRARTRRLCRRRAACGAAGHRRASRSTRRTATCCTSSCRRCRTSAATRYGGSLAESPALSARDLRGGARRLSGRTPGLGAPLGHRLGVRRLGPGRIASPSARRSRRAAAPRCT